MPSKTMPYLALCLFFATLPQSGHGQTLAHASSSEAVESTAVYRENSYSTSADRVFTAGSRGLPNAPDPQAQTHAQTAEAIPSSEDQARLTGLILDPSGAAIAGADVTLAPVGAALQATLKAGSDGHFLFVALPAGTYVVTITAKGFSPYTSVPVKLTARQAYDLPKVVLAIATADSEITVLPTEQLAAQQVQAEEKQRVLGVIPNFLTNYERNAAPLTAKQKFSLTAHDTFDPVSLLGVATAAGILQLNRTYLGYGNDAKGYGKRFGAVTGDLLLGDFFSHAIFPALLHEDPRYFYQGTGTIKQRFYHAASFGVVTRNDTGHLTPNLSYILGDLTAGGLSNLYYPHADRGAGLVFTNAAIGIGGHAAGAIFREFFSKRLTTNVPGDAKP